MVELSYENWPNHAVWVSSTDAYLGFTLPGNTAMVTSSCTHWDPAVWGDDIRALFSSFDWGAEMNAIDPGLLVQLQGMPDYADIATYFLGAGI